MNCLLIVHIFHLNFKFWSLQKFVSAEHFYESVKSVRQIKVIGPFLVAASLIFGSLFVYKLSVILR